MSAYRTFASTLDSQSPRAEKPREIGLTSIIDYGPGLHGWTSPGSLSDYLSSCAEFIDLVKVFGPNAVLLDEQTVRSSVKEYGKHGILAYAGGLLFEFAYNNGLLSRLPALLSDLGFSGIEISENYITLSRDELRKFISEYRDAGFVVIYEFGRKEPERPLTIKELSETLEASFSAGASHATIEQSEIDILTRESDDILDELYAQGWMRRVFIELDPLKFPNAQASLITRFGPDVNLANVTPNHLLSVEGFRRGIGRAVRYPLFTADPGVSHPNGDCVK